MPIVVYGGAIAMVLLVNPLLARLRSAWVLQRGELAVIVALTLAACFVPGRGLMHCMPTSIMLPHHYARTAPGWRSENVLDYAPREMLADVSEDEDRALNGYVRGLAQGDSHIGLADVPWQAWRRTLAFWVPLILSITVGSMGLALVVHRQWAHHEQLPYPISTFAQAIFPEPGRVVARIFTNRLFLVGLLFVLFIHMNNYAFQWWPEVLVYIPRQLNFGPVANLMPLVVRAGGWPLFTPLFVFSVIGLSYFLASDVAFSLGMIPWIYYVIAGILTQYGVVLRSGHHMSLKIESFVYAGGYFGIFLTVVYTGRHYYWQVLRRSLLLDRGRSPRHAVAAAWGMRVFLLGTGLFVGQLIRVGLDWQLAVLYAGFVVVLYVVISRTIAEAGAYFIGTEIFPGAILWGFFGAAALGPSTMVIMFMVGVVVLAAPGWAPMPFMVQGLRLADNCGVEPRRTARWGAIVLVLSLAVALPMTLYWQYDRGALSTPDGWMLAPSQFPYDNLVTIKQKLELQGLLEQAESVRGFERLAHIKPDFPCVGAFVGATVVALILAAGRLRFSWWPLHPVVFVFLGGYQSMMMAPSFFMGWLLKNVIVRYGGARLYQRLKPLMIGLIAGDMIAGAIPMLIGAVYYLITGDVPKNYWISAP
jgi:hypothetical protein